MKRELCRKEGLADTSALSSLQAGQQDRSAGHAGELVILDNASIILDLGVFTKSGGKCSFLPQF